jgi:hypothetical protein
MPVHSEAHPTLTEQKESDGDALAGPVHVVLNPAGQNAVVLVGRQPGARFTKF